MQINGRKFSYPVLYKGGEFYNDSSFETYVTNEREGYDIRITFHAKLSDNLLEQMLKERKLSYLYHIECPNTSFRVIKMTNDEDCSILIKDRDVDGKVEISSLIIANEDISKYTNPNFTEDFRGFKFNFDKGTILAVGTQYKLMVNKYRDDLANKSSIFSIVKLIGEEYTNMEINLDKPKIVIALPEKTFNQYTKTGSNLTLQPIMHSLILVPALVYALSELKNNEDKYNQYVDHRWFKGLSKAANSININIDEDGIKDIDVYKVAQQLLDSPIMSAVNYFSISEAQEDDD